MKTVIYEIRRVEDNRLIAVSMYKRRAEVLQRKKEESTRLLHEVRKVIK